MTQILVNAKQEKNKETNKQMNLSVKKSRILFEFRFPKPKPNIENFLFFFNQNRFPKFYLFQVCKFASFSGFEC